jgi:hypothetical protein
MFHNEQRAEVAFRCYGIKLLPPHLKHSLAVFINRCRDQELPLSKKKIKQHHVLQLRTRLKFLCRINVACGKCALQFILSHKPQAQTE